MVFKEIRKAIKEEMQYHFKLESIGGWILATLAFIYVVLPVDIFPDPIPIIGAMDDSMIFLLSFILGTGISRGIFKYVRRQK